MERAITRNQPQVTGASKPQNQAKSVAVGCDQLPAGAHGKEEVTAVDRSVS